MKFFDYLSAPGVKGFAIRTGILFALPAALVLGSWGVGLVVFAIVAILTSLIMPLILYRHDLPYSEAKKELEQPFLFDERVRFRIKNGIVSGFFVLTRERMVFLSLENGMHRVELSRDDVRSVILNENLTINIYLNDKQFIRVISNMTEDMIEILRDNGWNVRE